MSDSRVRPLRAVPPTAEGDRLRAVLDHLPLQIGYWDADLCNRLANQAYAASYGLTPEQIRGRHLRDVMGDKAFLLNEPYLQAALEGRPQQFDRTSVDAAGETSHTTEVHTPDLDEAGVVRGIRVVVTDVTARVKAEMGLAAATREIERLASTDPLTGLASRRVLNERAELSLAGLRRAQPGARSVGVLMLDLDGLARVNELLGKEVGDEILVEVGRRLTQVARETDVVARMGGDEFVVLMPGLSRHGDVTGLADRIVALVNEPMVLASYPAELVQVSTSLGVAVGISGAPDLSVQGLLREADRLMFQVKKQGGNRWARDPNAQVFEVGRDRAKSTAALATSPTASPVAARVPAPRTATCTLDQRIG